MVSSGHERALLIQLAERGYGREQLEQVRDLVDAVNSDLFDVLAIYSLICLPRQEMRAAEIDADRLFDGNDEVSTFLRKILKSYVDEGEEQLGNAQLEEHMKAKYNSVGEGR